MVMHKNSTELGVLEHAESKHAVKQEGFKPNGMNPKPLWTFSIKLHLPETNLGCETLKFAIPGVELADAPKMSLRGANQPLNVCAWRLGTRVQRRDLSKSGTTRRRAVRSADGESDPRKRFSRKGARPQGVNTSQFRETPLISGTSFSIPGISFSSGFANRKWH